MQLKLIRQNKLSIRKLKSIYQLINLEYKNEWLLKYEILELIYRKSNEPWVKNLYNDLKEMSMKNNDFSKALKRGLHLLKK